MKIAFLHYHHSTQSRGAESFVAELSHRLGESNKTRVFSHPNPRVDSRSKISIFQRFYVDRLSLSIAKWTITEIKALSVFNPDIVVCLNGGWQSLILRTWTLLRRKKLVIPGQSGPGWDDRWNLLCHPDIFVCLTNRQLKWAKKATIWPNQKFSLIPNGVDLEKFNPKVPRAKLPLKKPIVLIVASAEKAKRVGQAIAAVSNLGNTSLLWIGKGPLEKELEELGKKQLRDRFLHLSESYSQMPKYYASVDAFTLCSQSSEAFGIVYLEALASGLPVVATNDESRREIVGEAGFYVDDPNDSYQYSQAIQKALIYDSKDKSLQQVSNFSWDNLSNKYQELFEAL